LDKILGIKKDEDLNEQE